MNNKQIIKYFRKILLVISGLLFIYLLWMNFSPLGEQTITYKFQDNVFTEGLRPSTRIQNIECLKDFGCSQEVFSDPIYFDLLLPRKFQSVKLEVKYQDLSQKEVKIGVRVGDEWQYYQETLVIKEIEDQWLTGTAILNLKTANIQGNKATFMFSAPHIKDNAETVRIKEIKFYLSRDSYIKSIKNTLNAWYVKIFK